MKIIGITGSSGTGKTTVSKILGEYDYIEIIDCDKIAKEIAVPGNIYLETIKKEFGSEYFLVDGNLNRRMLAETIYNNKEKLEKLNNITFKYVVEEILNQINKIKEDKSIKIIAIDAPLLFESNLDKNCDYVISLVANEDIKIDRICKRDNINKEFAQKRLKIQKEDNFYTSKSDFIIENNDESNLKNTIEKILNKIEENI